MISPQAYVSPDAKIGNNVQIYPFAYIEENTVIGDNCVIYPYVSIMKGARLGRGNTIYQNAVIGATPQDFFWKGGDSEVVIGDKNVIRENVVISRSTDPTLKTTIGNKNVLLEGTHISHNVVIGNKNVFGYSVKISSDCTIGDHAILSSNVIAKPRCRIGDMAFILSGCRFGEDVPPYITAEHNPIEYGGVNQRQLSHHDIDERTIRHIANAYRLVFNSKVSLFDAINQIEEQVPDGPEIRKIVEFLRSSKGIISKEIY